MDKDRKQRNHVKKLLLEVDLMETDLAEKLSAMFGENVSLQTVSKTICVPPSVRPYPKTREGIFSLLKIRLPDLVKEYKDVWLEDRPGTITAV